VETVTIPVVEEFLQVDRQTVVTGGVRIVKTVQERPEVVDEPVTTEEVTVERVPINRQIDRPVAVRHEGDTTIVPIFEEITVVEKRLMLKEELHITRRQVVTSHPRVISLQSETATVEHLEPRELLTTDGAQEAGAIRTQGT
jgi:uncharacterized protein (TIGR02271 family)